MATTIVTPDALVIGTEDGAALTGSPTGETALGDDSDATYIYRPRGAGPPTNAYDLHTTWATFPPGVAVDPALIVDMRLRVRILANRDGTGAQTSIATYDGSAILRSTLNHYPATYGAVEWVDCGSVVGMMPTLKDDGLRVFLGFGDPIGGTNQTDHIAYYEAQFVITDTLPEPVESTVTYMPLPRRLTQRGDGLFGGAPRLIGNKSRQSSNRLNGGFL